MFEIDDIESSLLQGISQGAFREIGNMIDKKIQIAGLPVHASKRRDFDEPNPSGLEVVPRRFQEMNGFGYMLKDMETCKSIEWCGVDGCLANQAMPDVQAFIPCFPVVRE